MAFSSLMMVGPPLPAVLGEKHLPNKRPVTITTKTALPLQVKSEKGWKPEEPINLGVSRRDMMMILTAGILSVPADPVEARVVKPEIRRKIREKLDKLREEAGLSKPKNENGIKTKLSTLSPPKPSPNKPIVAATLP